MSTFTDARNQATVAVTTTLIALLAHSLIHLYNKHAVPALGIPAYPVADGQGAQ